MMFVPPTKTVSETAVGAPPLAAACDALILIFVIVIENAPGGATLYYVLPKDPGAVRLEITDARARVVGVFTSEKHTEPNPPEVYSMAGRYERETILPAHPGLNRFVWDLRYAVVDVAPDTIVWGYTGGPRAAPGVYQVKLSRGAWSQTQPLTVGGKVPLVIQLAGGGTVEAVATVRPLSAE